MFTVDGKYTTAKVMIDDVEPSCLSQINHFTNHLAFTNPIAIMPDTHAGKGSVIGFTMEMTERVIPNVVGVDIGCGMLSLEIGKDLKLSLEDLDRKIRSAIPFGSEFHDHPLLDMRKDFPWHKVNVQAEKFAMAYNDKFGVRLEVPRYDIDWFLNKSKEIEGDLKRVINSLGTLGGGNHFIETGISNNGNIWITIHSGARNFGKRVCELWQHRAIKVLREDKRDELQDRIKLIKEKYKETPRTIKEKIREVKAELNLDSGIDMKGCEWLEDSAASGYLFDMIFSQMYATMNRELMARVIEKIIKSERTDEIETVHNFIDFQDFVIRKGSIRSYKNERMIIPFNMRDGILVCEGKSNPDWNYSAPHGAGRTMSRSQANKHLDVDEFAAQMQGIYSTSVGQNTLDEAPGAYKDAKIIEEAIEPTATIIDKIRPIHNMKDGGKSFRKKK